MSKNKIAVLILVGIMFLVGIPASLYLVRQQQETESQAQQQTCVPPAAPTNVEVEYPNCGDGTIGSQCNPNEALCKWNPVSDAVSYSLVVTNVDSSQIVLTQSVPGSSTSLPFPVTPNLTYRCEVAAVNSCGATGTTGAGQALCAADDLLLTPTPTPTVPVSTPTPIPTQPPIFTPSPTLITVLPTDTPVPTTEFTPSPIPSIPVVGSADTSIMLGVGVAALLIVGSLIFLL